MKARWGRKHFFFISLHTHWKLMLHHILQFEGHHAICFWHNQIVIKIQCMYLYFTLDDCNFMYAIWFLMWYFYVHRHRENFWTFTRPRKDFGLMLLILNMIIHKGFTGPTHILSADVQGPVSFAVSVYIPCFYHEYALVKCALPEMT